jgi:hypothetical protein
MIPSPSEASLWGAVAQWGLVTSLAVLQIKSTLPCLVCAILRMAGWKKRDPLFWPERGFDGMDRDQWSDWSTTAASTWFGSKVFYLLNCGYCLCFHLTWTTSIVVLVAIRDPWSALLAPAVFALSVRSLSSS